MNRVQIFNLGNKENFTDKITKKLDQFCSQIDSQIKTEIQKRNKKERKRNQIGCMFKSSFNFPVLY